MGRPTRKGETVPYHVGDRVVFRFGATDRTGVVIEDRGSIGVGGRRLFRIRSEDDPYFPFEIELPAVEMQPAVETRS